MVFNFPRKLKSLAVQLEAKQAQYAVNEQKNLLGGMASNIIIHIYREKLNNANYCD